MLLHRRRPLARQGAAGASGTAARRRCGMETRGRVAWADLEDSWNEAGPREILCCCSVVSCACVCVCVCVLFVSGLRCVVFYRGQMFCAIARTFLPTLWHSRLIVVRREVCWIVTYVDCSCLKCCACRWWSIRCHGRRVHVSSLVARVLEFCSSAAVCHDALWSAGCAPPSTRAREHRRLPRCHSPSAEAM